MIYTIPKGWHYSIPAFPIPSIKNSYKWEVTFDDSCKYDINGPDQLDWNKLVGVSNYLNPRKESIRFVWRYIVKMDLFEIATYIEENKNFKTSFFCYVKSNELLSLSMKFVDGSVAVSAKGCTKILNFPKNKLTFRCNPYFGGNQPAPHTMNLKLKTRNFFWKLNNSQ